MRLHDEYRCRDQKEFRPQRSHGTHPRLVEATALFIAACVERFASSYEKDPLRRAGLFLWSHGLYYRKRLTSINASFNRVYEVR